jgi:hypothetical protein
MFATPLLFDGAQAQDQLGGDLRASSRSRPSNGVRGRGGGAPIAADAVGATTRAAVRDIPLAARAAEDTADERRPAGGQV